VSICGVRVPRFVTAAALVGAMLGAANGQTSASQGQKSPAELARIIADGVRATTRTVPGAPIALGSATSHDNVVEIRYVVTDVIAFGRFKANIETARRSTASLYCNEGRRAFLDQGVVLHEVFALADGRDQVDFTVDKSSCDSLPKTPTVDAKTLAGLALAAASAENAESAGRAASAVRFGGATARDGVVDVRFTVADPAAAQRDLRGIVSVLAGFYCTKYLGSISQGLAFHLAIAPTSGPSIFEFIIDRTKC
jgi:hypothetical protein